MHEALRGALGLLADLYMFLFLMRPAYRRLSKCAERVGREVVGGVVHLDDWPRDVHDTSGGSVLES